MAEPVRFEITGTEQFNEALKIAGKKFANAAAAALYQMGLKTIAIAIRVTPVDTGRLRASNYCAPPTVNDAGTMTCEVGFGVSYGIFVHERTDLRHKAPTRAKFLQHALDVVSNGYFDELGKRIASNFAAGIGVEAIDAGDVSRFPTDGEIALAHSNAKRENRRRDSAKRRAAVGKYFRAGKTGKKGH